MTDVPSKHVWKIKESRIVFKDFDIIAVVPTFWIYINTAISINVVGSKHKTTRQDRKVVWDFFMN